MIGHPAQTQIWKFVLPIKDEFRLEMPAGAMPLCIMEQKGLLFLWARIMPGAEKEVRRFSIFGTGNPIPAKEPLVYIGSCVMKEGRVVSLVWHLFELLPAELE